MSILNAKDDAQAVANAAEPLEQKALDALAADEKVALDDLNQNIQALIAESQEWRKLAAGLPGKIETAVTAALKRTITIS